MDSWIRDTHYGLRSLRKQPVVTGMCLAAIALGMGANAAVFTLVNEILLRPLPVENPAELAVIHVEQPGSNSFSGFSYPELVDYRERSAGVASIGAMSGIGLRLGDSDRVQIPSNIVSGDYFELFGVEPAQGRIFGRAEAEVDGAPRRATNRCRPASRSGSRPRRSYPPSRAPPTAAWPWPHRGARGTRRAAGARPVGTAEASDSRAALACTEVRPCGLGQALESRALGRENTRAIVGEPVVASTPALSRRMLTKRAELDHQLAILEVIERAVQGDGPQANLLVGELQHAPHDAVAVAIDVGEG